MYILHHGKLDALNDNMCRKSLFFNVLLEKHIEKKEDAYYDAFIKHMP